MTGYRPVPYRRRKTGKRKVWLYALVTTLLVFGAGFAYISGRQGESEPNGTSAQSQNDNIKTEEKPSPPLVDLQPVVNAWLAKQTAEYGIVVYDPANKKTIAAHDPDRKFFAASLYKIFVAYLALADFQSGAQDPGAILTQGFTKKECVDKMIRESHSPCGEAMMAEMGQAALRQRVSDMGIKNTIFAGITTTAQDSALILQYIVEKRDLNAANTDFLKDAMRVQDQRFRNGLAKGATEATWETKVGWNEHYNYHDIGIMTLPGGRQYVVAILSQDNGSSAPIANFAATIYQALK